MTGNLRGDTMRRFCKGSPGQSYSNLFCIQDILRQESGWTQIHEVCVHCTTHIRLDQRDVIALIDLANVRRIYDCFHNPFEKSASTTLGKATQSKCTNMWKLYRKRRYIYTLKKSDLWITRFSIHLAGVPHFGQMIFFALPTLIITCQQWSWIL